MSTNLDSSKVKFTLALTPEQTRVLDVLQKGLNASSRSEVIRKALSLAELFVDVSGKGQKLCIADQDGRIIETLRFV